MGYKISVLGDSMSTLYGYSNNVVNPNEHNEYYPRNDVLSEKDTWWHILLRKLGAKLCVNQSWSGRRGSD